MAVLTLSGEIRNVDFADALGERYLSYALSTIMYALAARCARRVEAGPSPDPARDCSSSASILPSG